MTSAFFGCDVRQTRGPNLRILCADAPKDAPPENSPPPAGASQNPEQLCFELSEVVSGHRRPVTPSSHCCPRYAKADDGSAGAGGVWLGNIAFRGMPPSGVPQFSTSVFWLSPSFLSVYLEGRPQVPDPKSPPRGRSRTTSLQRSPGTMRISCWNLNFNNSGGLI